MFVRSLVSLVVLLASTSVFASTEVSETCVGGVCVGMTVDAAKQVKGVASFEPTTIPNEAQEDGWRVCFERRTCALLELAPSGRIWRIVTESGSYSYARKASTGDSLEKVRKALGSVDTHFNDEEGGVVTALLVAGKMAATLECSDKGWVIRDFVVWDSSLLPP